MCSNAQQMKFKTYHFGDLFKVKHGYAFKGKFFSDEGPYVVLTPGNFFEEGGFKSRDKEKRYDGEVPEGYVLSQGDLIVAMTEQSPGLLGSSALVPEDDVYLHNQRLGLICDVERDKLDETYLYYLFNTYRVRAQISATASGTKVRHTSPSRIYEVKVELPPLAVQRRIAGILSAYDDLMAANARRIELLEAMAQAVYRAWFVHHRYPGHAADAMRPTDALGEVPAGWEVVTMSDLLTRHMDTVKPYESEDETFAYFSFAAFDEGRRPKAEQGEAIRSNKHGVREDSVLLARLNPRIPRVWMAFPRGPHRPITSTEFMVLAPDAPITQAYLYALLASDAFLRRFQSLASGTSTSHQRVSPRDFLAMPVAQPPEALVTQFSEYVTPMLHKAEALRQQSANLRQTRDLLLPRLVSGALTVEAAEESGVEA
jgi:type I restriction enzyme S subunit